MEKAKRKKIIIISAVISLIIICAGILCYYFIFKFHGEEESDNKHWESENVLDYSGFSVTYLNVGNGDCAIIKFDDGKIMMIDTGSGTVDNYNLIEKTLNNMKVDSIEYLVLTHPHNSHIGNAKKLLENKKVNNLYIPKIYDYTLFSDLKDIVESAEKMKIKLIISDNSCNLSNGESKVFFLAPRPSEVDSSIYNELFEEQNPTDELIKDLSPIIYVEYNGIRFLFTGDGGVSVESTVLELYESNLLNENVVLESIDFFKVSNHGQNYSTTNNFLQKLLPKTAIISTGNDEYGSFQLIDRLYKINENIRILRTNVDGSITVFVDEKGKTDIIAERK